jgi:hypothetical protein
MLATQEFLRRHGVQALRDRFSIKANPHPRWPNLWLLVYDQINSPKSEPVTWGCRGHIYDESNDWALVCRPYDRFFNYGEMLGLVPVPDYASARAAVKEDGTLCPLYFYGGEWNVSTKGTPNAGGPVGNTGYTFASLFWETWNQLGYSLPKETGYTFIFELCSLENKVVCVQKSRRIILTGVRETATGREIDPDQFSTEFEVVKTVPFTSVDQIKQTFQNLPAIENEGYIIVQYKDDGVAVRQKVKHPGWLALSLLKSGLSDKGILEIVRQGEIGEVLSYFPEYTERFTRISTKLETEIARLTELYEGSKRIESQREFALAIRGEQLNQTLFQVRKNGTPIRTCLAQMNLDSLARSLNIREEKLTDEG